MSLFAKMKSICAAAAHSHDSNAVRKKLNTSLPQVPVCRMWTAGGRGTPMLPSCKYEEYSRKCGNTVGYRPAGRLQDTADEIMNLLNGSNNNSFGHTFCKYKMILLLVVM